MTGRPPRLVFLTTAAERQMRRWIARRGSARTTGDGGPGLGAAAAGVLLHLATHPLSRRHIWRWRRLGRGSCRVARVEVD